jgi:uncharacterized membrane protein YheB (UPF0754 family)
VPGVSHSIWALISVPFVTGAIGYVTNWTGVVMLFYPVHFRGIKAHWLLRAGRFLPRRVQQIPGIMVGGIGWQGIVPSRASKMGSLAVDVGIAKLGSPSEFFQQLDPPAIAAQILERMRPEAREHVDRVMEREHPRLWSELPRPIRELVHERVQSQLPGLVQELTEKIGANIEQLVDVKLMVIRRFDPELANRVFLDMGQEELTFIKNFGGVFGFLLGIPVAFLTHFVTYWWLLPIIGVIVGYTTNWMALWMIYEPAEPRRYGPLRLQGLFIRRQPEVAEVYARIVADEIVTVSNFASELLHGPQSDRTRALIEQTLRPAIDRAAGPLQPALRAALGTREYESIREAFAAEPADALIEPLSDPEFSRARSGAMRKLIAERMKEMRPRDFAEMLHTATREDEWLLLLHGAILGFAGGLIHLAIFR